MNNDLISRSALLENECCGRISGDAVRNAPAVDAEPVRHGCWILVSKQIVIRGELCFADGYECSECHKGSSGDDYCEKCGAKMDLEANDDELP